MAKLYGVHLPAETKNYIINGNMDWFQRGTTFTAVNNAANQAVYAADRWKNNTSNVGGSAVNYQMSQSTNVPSAAQSGFDSTYSLQVTNITGITLLAGGYYLPYFYQMEGLDYQRLVGKNVVFSFWVYASIAGTYSFSLQNGVGTRSYVTTFNVAGANSWQFVSIPVTLDSSITGYTFDNSAGFRMFIAPSAGSNSQTSTLNSWQSANVLAATGANSLSSTSGATMAITQVSMVEGSVGIGPTGFQRAGKTIQQELSLCQRYYQSVVVGHDFYAANSSQVDRVFTVFPTQMRAAPTVVSTAINSANLASATVSGLTNYYMQLSIVGSSAGNVGSSFSCTLDSDL